METWITNSNLGSIDVGDFSNFRIEANFPQDSTVLYSTNDLLPPGLTLEMNGFIIGTVTQIDDILGITTVDSGATTFDTNNTNYDHKFTFSVTAEGITTGTKIQQEFTIQVNTVAYVNIFGKAFLSTNQRLKWIEFINNTQIFADKYLYEPLNKNFGVQKELNLLIHAGVKKETSDKFISAIGLHHKTKRFYFGEIKFAQAIVPGTREIKYEVVYVEIKDPLEQDNKILPDKLKFELNNNQIINADNNSTIFWTRKLDELSIVNPYNTRPKSQLNAAKTSYLASDPDFNLYYVNSISHWKNQFKNWRDDENYSFLIERNCLPLWMRSIQTNNSQELGYIPAVVLCYCKKDMAKKIITNINNSKFNFDSLDFIIDRYIIVDKYIRFNEDQNVI